MPPSLLTNGATHGARLDNRTGYAIALVLPTALCASGMKCPPAAIALVKISNCDNGLSLLVTTRLLGT
ncbi:MAG: hypothetical protein F6K28_02460 [Microcoleus sp. SIO2G3]|nr:hypothetical protein [Microcoleus sp. SIO2G3]